MRGTLDEGCSAGDLVSAVTPTGIAFPLLLLIAEVLSKNSNLGLVCIKRASKPFHV
jgi:hypothetical protein